MAKKRSARKTTKKSYKTRKVYKRKRRAVTQYATTRVGEPVRIAAPIPLPLRYSTKLRYTSTHIIQSGTSGTLSSSPLRFSLSSMYDPDQTNIGHQPYGFDQLAALYGKYKVNRAKVTIQWFDVGATNTGMCCAALRPSTNTTSPASLPFHSFVEKQVGGHVLLTSTGNNRCVEQTFNVDLRKIFGVTKAEFADEEFYAANVNADPTNQIFIEFASAFPSSSSAIDVNAVVIVEYFATFYNRVTLGAS